MARHSDNWLKRATWYSLSVVLRIDRVAPTMRSHPLSVIQAISKGVTSLVGADNGELAIFHIKGKRHRYKFRQGNTIPVDFMLLRCDQGFASSWAVALERYLMDPVTGRNLSVVSMHQIEARNYGALMQDIGDMPKEGEICLDFLTPFPFTREKDKDRTYLDERRFVRSFEKRFSRLFGGRIPYNGRKDDFELLPYYWRYTEIRHQSSSQPGSIQLVNGCVGPLYIRGTWPGLIPFLALGSELHAGKKLSNAQGYFTLQKGSRPYFKRFFPSAKNMLSVTRDVIDRYDHAVESLATTQGYPFDEKTLAADLCNEIVSGSYTPSPHVAFKVKKKGGDERLVEQPSFRDLIVQLYLLRAVSPVFERCFEKSSIGFRKGRSRMSLINMVKQAVADGFRYVVESDIEDFFPSVDHSILRELIDRYIPIKDDVLKETLWKSVTTGHVLHGTYYERNKGLAQGSPLSPILANLYLDSFDEEMQTLNVRLVRYADDFIILVKCMEDARSALAAAKESLAELGLGLKIEKTMVRPIKEGFSFLGLEYDGTAFQRDEAALYKRYKKPLYITEPWLYVGMNGDAVDVRRGGKIMATIPLRRISEIIMMERAVLSTALARKCVENHIPITLTLNSGYYVTTIKPDSKKYHEISFRHGLKYASLGETEILCIAKEFAAGKIRNYIPLYRQRYRKGFNRYIRMYEDAIASINMASTINEVRGIEGSIARKTFQAMNLFINDERFHLKKRERKKPDRINSLLNVGYYLLFSRINATIRSAGLNPYLGFLHAPANTYESLVSDVEELFRSRIDRLVIRLVNLKTIKTEDFVETARGQRLVSDAFRRFVNQFEGELARKENRSELSLGEHIHVQVGIIKRWVVDKGSFSVYTWTV